MLFMVIEHFKGGNAAAVGERFKQKGRMLPEGVIYHTSWVDAPAARCFQVMEAPQRQLLNDWVERWRDLVDFEIIPVVTSSEYWSKQTRE